MRRLEERSPGVEFSYWIEGVLLSSLRRMVLDRIRDDGEGDITSFSEIAFMLSEPYLRSLAPKLRQIGD